MNKEQAINMLRLIADLYKVINSPDQAPAQAPASTNGQREEADLAQAQPMTAQ